MNKKEEEEETGKIGFVGRQIGRVFIGDKYTSFLYRMVVMLLFLKVFIDVPNEVILLLVPFWLVFVWCIGIYVDKTKLDQEQIAKNYEQGIKGNVMVTEILWRETIIPQLKEAGILIVVKEEE